MAAPRDELVRIDTELARLDLEEGEALDTGRRVVGLDDVTLRDPADGELLVVWVRARRDDLTGWQAIARTRGLLRSGPFVADGDAATLATRLWTGLGDLVGD